MTTSSNIQDLTNQEYKYGFVTDIEADSAPPGLNEDIIAFISAKKGEPEFMLEWRLKAYRHWLTMKEPSWSNVRYPPIDYQATIYYSAPKAKPKSLDEVEDLVKHIAHDLRNHYTISYTPTNANLDGTWREITVKINPPKNMPKFTSHTKQGYYAPTKPERNSTSDN